LYIFSSRCRELLIVNSIYLSLAPSFLPAVIYIEFITIANRYCYCYYCLRISSLSIPPSSRQRSLFPFGPVAFPSFTCWLVLNQNRYNKSGTGSSIKKSLFLLRALFREGIECIKDGCRCRFLLVAFPRFIHTQAGMQGITTRDSSPSHSRKSPRVIRVFSNST
jgi:hypothetical protein